MFGDARPRTLLHFWSETVFQGSETFVPVKENLNATVYNGILDDHGRLVKALSWFNMAPTLKARSINNFPLLFWIYPKPFGMNRSHDSCFHVTVTTTALRLH